MSVILLALTSIGLSVAAQFALKAGMVNPFTCVGGRPHLRGRESRGAELEESGVSADFGTCGLRSFYPTIGNRVPNRYQRTWRHSVTRNLAGSDPELLNLSHIG